MIPPDEFADLSYINSCSFQLLVCVGIYLDALYVPCPQCLKQGEDEEDSKMPVGTLESPAYQYVGSFCG